MRPDLQYYGPDATFSCFSRAVPLLLVTCGDQGGSDVNEYVSAGDCTENILVLIPEFIGVWYACNDIIEH